MSCGILGKGDKCRVKVVRETKDRRHIDGKFPPCAEAFGVQYEEVEFENHQRAFSREEIKNKLLASSFLHWHLSHNLCAV